MADRFIDINERAYDRVEERTDELLINGQSITRSMDGYKQMTVTRQEIMPWELETVQHLARSGVSVTSSRKAPRVFTIRYRLTAESSEDLRYKFNQLVNILDSVEEIEFRDEPDYFYKDVWLTGSEAVEETSNLIESSFTLTAQDPYKYKKETITTDRVRTDKKFVPVEEITIEFAETVERPRIVIQNGIYVTDFRLLGTVLSGTTVRIKINNVTGRVETTGARLELGSMPREFLLYDGARATVQGSSLSTVEFTYREWV